MAVKVAASAFRGHATMGGEEHENMASFRYMSRVGAESGEAGERKSCEATEREHPTEVVVDLSRDVTWLVVDFVGARAVREKCVMTVEPHLLRDFKGALYNVLVAHSFWEEESHLFVAHVNHLVDSTFGLKRVSEA